MKKSQTIYEAILIFFFLFFFLVLIMNSFKYSIDLSFYRIDDIYASLISLDKLGYLNYHNVSEAYNILKEEFDVCMIYKDKILGDCTDKKIGIFYIVWDPYLNETVELNVYIK